MYILLLTGKGPVISWLLGGWEGFLRGSHDLSREEGGAGGGGRGGAEVG